AGLFGNSATDGLARRPALRTPGIARNIVHYCLLSKGDQAGSEPSIGVFMTRSLCPVRSIEWSCVRPLGSWVEKARTRPLGRQVRPSTSQPCDNMRSPDPSGRITPI